jgi:type I restriction enzyme, S subunit
VVGRMTKLEKLIEELCPDGVKYLHLAELAEIGTGSSNTNEELANGKYPFFVRSQEVRSKDEFEFDEEAIITSGDGVGVGKIFHYINGKYALHQRAYRIHFKDERMLTKFFLYYMKATFLEYIEKNAVNSSVTSVRRPMMNEYPVPLPPLPIQREIVSILDKFTELTVELTVELTDRKKQYKYYSTALFDNAKKSGVGFIKDICCIEKGKTPIQKAIPGEYPMVVTTTERKSCDSYQFDTKAVCIPLVSSRGHGVASLNHVYYQEGKFALGNILCALIPKDEAKVSPKYLYYYFEQTKDYTLVSLMKGGANVALHIKDIEKLKIPIPLLSEQQRIVNILDRFDSLCNDISKGLPAEIDERQKQYEHYRDKLLTFKNIDAEV